MDVEGPGDGADGLAVGDEVAGELLLIGRHLSGPAEGHAARLGGQAPFFRAAEDEGALKLGDAGEDRHDHAARGAGGVGPGFVERLQPGLFVGYALGDAQQFGG